jgi:hypothetical protein
MQQLMSLTRRSFWSRVTIAGALGFVLAAVVFMAGHQVIYPALCTIDGTVWAAWAQVAALILVGGAATWTAFYQLNRFNDNERFKTTLALLDDFEKTKRSILFGEMTPHEATSVTMQIGLSAETLAAFSADSNLFKGKSREEVVGNPDGERYYRCSNAAIMVSNYFSKVGTLVKRNAVDRDLLFKPLGVMIQQAYVACANISQVESWSWSLKDFEYLRDAVLEWNKEVDA